MPPHAVRHVRDIATGNAIQGAAACALTLTGLQRVRTQQRAAAGGHMDEDMGCTGYAWQAADTVAPPLAAARIGSCRCPPPPGCGNF